MAIFMNENIASQNLGSSNSCPDILIYFEFQSGGGVSGGTLDALEGGWMGVMGRGPLGDLAPEQN